MVGGLPGILGIPRPFLLDVGSAGDSRFLSGFYPTERTDDGVTFRWSQPEAVIHLYGMRPGTALLMLRLHHHQTGTLPPLTIQGEQAQAIGPIPIEPGWRYYQLLLPEEATASPGFSAAKLNLVTKTVRSMQRDGRSLAIPVDQVAVKPLSSPCFSPLQWLVVVERWVVVLWGIGICSGMFWFLNRTLFPQSSTQAMFDVWLWQVAGLSFVLLLWFANDPFVSAWAWAHWSFPRWRMVVVTLVVSVFACAKIFAPRWSRWFRPFPVLWWVERRRSRVMQSRNTWWLIVVVLTVVAHAMVIGGWPGSGISSWFIVALPGALLVLLLMRGTEHDPLALHFVMMSGAFAVAPLLLLIIQAWPGPVPKWTLWLLCDGVSVIVGWLLLRSPPPGVPHAVDHFAPQPFWPIGLVLLIAAMLRFPFLGSAEFQGDEAQVVLMGAGVVFGEDDILMLHRKGPMEILLAATPLVFTNRLNEWMARFPFATAGVANVLGCYLLTSRFFRSRWAGGGAAAILAVEGFCIGFSRIVQYQQIVILMSMAGIWCSWRFAATATSDHPSSPHRLQDDKEAWRYVLLGGVFASVGLLAHYDALFALLTMGWLFAVGGVRRGWRGKAWARGLWPALLGSVSLLSFYLPYTMHDHFAKTLAYLTTMRIGAPQGAEAILLSNNLGSYFSLASYYNTSYEVWTAISVLGMGMILWLTQWGWPKKIIGWLAAAVLLMGIGISRWAPEQLVIANRVDLTIVFFALPLGVLLCSPLLPHSLRTIVLWFAAAFLTESFVIANPNTHFYTMVPPAAILMGWSLVWGWRWAKAQQWLWVYSPLLLWFIALVGLSLPYRFLLYLQQSPEYDRMYPAYRPAWYLASYGDQRPRGGRFGFPHRDGWKVVGELYRLGILDGPYATNQKPIITTWYLRGIPYGFLDEPMPYFFSARREKFAKPSDDYQLFGWVEVDGERMLDLYHRGREEHLGAPPRVYHLHDYRDSFDAQPIHPFPIPRELFVLEVPGRVAKAACSKHGHTAEHHPPWSSTGP